MGVAAAQLSDAEVARRLPVWRALSDIFLDTELDPHHYRRMADAIAQSGFSASEAEAIFRDEVAPAFAANLWDVAGEWQGWPDDYVRERVLAKRGSALSKAANWLFHREMLDREWARVADFLRA
ncbi:MAG: hypothetical protein CVT85_04305 [Alphaproteobacteria bacterium HGW-Alphaproteobacteria-7]|jgi:hypothetical protein|nr:MAG: hypothetical protein CVT85_04305 [Alphaproteobacteria bacterium HGW-Alphaproteobacteria-7]